MNQSIYCYTVWVDGVEMCAWVPHYHWAKVCKFLGVERSQIRRGAKAGTPLWEKEASK